MILPLFLLLDLNLFVSSLCICRCSELRLFLCLPFQSYDDPHMMRDELIDGGKVYLVYPIIDESEQLPQLRAATAEFDSIKKKFEGYPCGLLHGRMRSNEKEETLSSFSGETRILLSTQVIEIGVDVPDASMMIVMNAERFGIAQLHQLRGRVGRGERKSRCIFLASTSSTLPRLKVLEKSSDGFYLANADLLLRGPGNLLGKKQSAAGITARHPSKVFARARDLLAKPFSYVQSITESLFLPSTSSPTRAAPRRSAPMTGRYTPSRISSPWCSTRPRGSPMRTLGRPCGTR